MIRIRLRRIGKKGTPHYRMVVAEKEAPRDGAFLDTLGSYDPHANPPSVKLDAARTIEWIQKGAKPSDSAEKILRRAGIVDANGKLVAGAAATAAPAAEESQA
jgi:small subunit ribosomal protein S16